mmetsp:Transcript_55325/g.75611  ORF Transcript_55325/g.75611 Transcript_55325/m.75611 type:complete len:83 (+) Transcript_55325:417-665(+)
MLAELHKPSSCKEFASFGMSIASGPLKIFPSRKKCYMPNTCGVQSTHRRTISMTASYVATGLCIEGKYVWIRNFFFCIQQTS